MDRLPFKKDLILLALAGLLALTIIMVAVLSLIQRPAGQKRPIDQLLPTITPASTDVTVDTIPLTEQEKSYPQATPQPFRHEEQKKTGTLVVTSNIEDVLVLLDATIHRDNDDPIQDKTWPINITPFTVTNMPVGEHYLLARKPGFVIAEQTYEVKANQVTRIHITMIPL